MRRASGVSRVVCYSPRHDLALGRLSVTEIGGGSFIADTSPEEKAAELRAVSLVHYKQR